MVGAAWQYGSAGDEIPVTVGSTWRLGPHILRCGDLEAGDAARLLADHGPADLCYSDPPWSAGNARAFRTKAGVSRPVDFSVFLDALLAAVSQVRSHVFLEMGGQHFRDLHARITQHGGRVLAAWGITYYRRHPCHLTHATWDALGCSMPSLDRLAGMDDEHTPLAALQAVGQPGWTVLDPCLGRGLTLRSADALGLRCLGLELHPRRLAVAIKSLMPRYDPVRLEG